MSDPIILKGKQPANADPTRIGISYSGGGPLVVIELGIARAFVRKGIVPYVIAGASAGALAGTAHALDPKDGKGIQLAAGVLGHVSNSLLGLDPFHVIGKVISERERFTSLGDNAAIGPRIDDALARELIMSNVTVGDFQPPDRPILIIAGTDMLTGSAVWFPNATPIADALVASSAIPGVFPWRTMTIGGVVMYIGDGGVVENQPLSTLVDQYKCGTLYACAVGPTDPLAPPRNALENALRAANFSQHQAMKLEEDYVRLKLGNTGSVHHLHPIVQMSTSDFDFTPELVEDLMTRAETATLAWLDESHPD